MTSLDVATASMVGADPQPISIARDGPEDPHTALADALRPALASGRCFLSFSGGRDSSAMLAFAVGAARREGLPDPIPVSVVYPEAPAAQEDDYQERVVRHLGLGDWERIEIRDELQLVGPVARRTLLGLGLLFPLAAYTLLPILERARGGVLVLARGHNDFFGYWRWTALADVLAGHRRPARGDLRQVATGLLPGSARTALLRRRWAPPPMPWLRPEPQRAADRAWTEQTTKAPFRYDKAVLVTRTHRCVRGSIRSLEALADEAGATALVPISDPRYLAAVLRAAGWRGWGSREHRLKLLAGDMLPAELLARRRPAHIYEVLFGEHTRAFAERWSGEGLDESLVDPGMLRAMWSGEHPDPRTSGLVQLAWLQDELAGRSREQVDAEAKAVISQ